MTGDGSDATNRNTEFEEIEIIDEDIYILPTPPKSADSHSAPRRPSQVGTSFEAANEPRQVQSTRRGPPIALEQELELTPQDLEPPVLPSRFVSQKELMPLRLSPPQDLMAPSMNAWCAPQPPSFQYGPPGMPLAIPPIPPWIPPPPAFLPFGMGIPDVVPPMPAWMLPPPPLFPFDQSTLPLSTGMPNMAPPMPDCMLPPPPLFPFYQSTLQLGITEGTPTVPWGAPPRTALDTSLDVPDAPLPPRPASIPPPPPPPSLLSNTRSSVVSHSEAPRRPPPTNQQRAPPGKTVVEDDEGSYVFIAPDMYIHPSVTSSSFCLFDVDFELRVYRHFNEHSSQFELRATLTALHATRPHWCLTVDCTVALINKDGFVDNDGAATYDEEAVRLSDSHKTWTTQKIIAWEKLCELENEFFLDDKHLVVSLTIIRRQPSENPSSRVRKKETDRKCVVVKRELNDDGEIVEVKKEVESEEEEDEQLNEREGGEKDVEEKEENHDDEVEDGEIKDTEDEEEAEVTSSEGNSWSVETPAQKRSRIVSIPKESSSTVKRKWWFGEDGDHSKEARLLVENKEIRVRRKSLCKYLKRFEEFDFALFDKGPYKIRGVSYADFRAFLWLTFWDAPSQLEGRLMMLAKLANVFQNDVVKRKCAEFLFDRSKTMPPGFLLFAGERYALREVVDRALGELRSLSQVFDVVTGRYYKKLSQELAIKILKELKKFK